MCWIFSNKQKRLSKEKLFIDIHSHILPGIDDGAETLEESLEMILAMKNVGYVKLIMTPHTMADVYKNTPLTIKKRLEFLQSKLIENGIDIEIEAASEYYLDDGFLKHLESGNILHFGERYVLVETSFNDKPINMEEMIFEIVSRGYIPVLAHPERYRYIKDFKKEYSRLKDLGLLFQVNMKSLTGASGKIAKEKVQFLINKGYVDFIGSDAHRVRDITHIQNVQKLDIMDTIFNRNKILNNTLI